MMGYGKRVLVVDNEEMVRHLLTEQLEQHEFVVVAVADGLKALGELQRRRFDAIITDMQMPHLNGLDLLRQSHLAWPDLPVILMSGHHEDIAGLAMARGAYACLPKPVDIGQVLNLFRKVMNQAVGF
jgi:DNA-binding NtrC family response regulator